MSQIAWKLYSVLQKKCTVVYLRGMVVSLATMIFVILNTYWIRWIFYLFAAISHCSLQGIFKNLHKVQHLAFLKWLLTFHRRVLEARTENVSFFDRWNWELKLFTEAQQQHILTIWCECQLFWQIELRTTIGSVTLMEHSVTKVQMTPR